MEPRLGSTIRHYNGGVGGRRTDDDKDVEEDGQDDPGDEPRAALVCFVHELGNVEPHQKDPSNLLLGPLRAEEGGKSGEGDGWRAHAPTTAMSW